jgi:hypothetical protein
MGLVHIYFFGGQPLILIVTTALSTHHTGSECDVGAALPQRLPAVHARQGAAVPGQGLPRRARESLPEGLSKLADRSLFQFVIDFGVDFHFVDFWGPKSAKLKSSSKSATNQPNVLLHIGFAESGKVPVPCRCVG